MTSTGDSRGDGQRELDPDQVKDAKGYRERLRSRGIGNRSQRFAYMERVAMERRTEKISAEEIMLRKSTRYYGWR